MHRGHAHRHGAPHQFALQAGDAEEMQRQHGQQVRTRHHAPGGEELVDGQHDAPLAPQRGQRLVGETVRPPGKAHQQVARRAVGVQAQGRTGQRMVVAHQADIFAVVQPQVGVVGRFAGLAPRREVGQHRRKVADCQVCAFVLQQRARVARAQWQHAHRHVRRFVRQQVHQARHQGRRRGVGHGQHKGVGGLQRHKVGVHQRRLQLRQRFAHHRPQRLGMRCGLHAAAAAPHQVVAQRLAQPAQRVAHGRLGERQLVRGARQALLGHDGIEHPQQVQIKAAKYGMRHGSYIFSL